MSHSILCGVNSEQTFQAPTAGAEQAPYGLDRAHCQPELHGLLVEYLDTGHTSFLTFSSAFDRGLFVIGLAGRQVALRPLTYRLG